MPRNTVLSVRECLLCECFPGQVLHRSPLHRLFLPCKPGSLAFSPAADPCGPQPQSSLGGSATSSPWCHPPTLSGNTPTSCLLSYAFQSQSSYSPKSKSGTPWQVPNVIWSGASHIVSCCLPLAQPSRHLLHHCLSLLNNHM